jgi:hypothetical protein
MVDTRFDPPLYMERGSYGPVVDKVLGFLKDWAEKQSLGPTGIVCDMDYGNTGVEWMKKYQKHNSLEDDGGCGPKTREQMLKDGFDFVQEAKSCGEPLTSFAQPGGATLFWCARIVPEKEMIDARANSRRAWHGN